MNQTILRKKSLIFKNKLLKTFGGFTALLLLANPINIFVDKQIMKKFISPGIDQISDGFVNESKMKTIFKNMDEAKSNLGKSVKTSNLIEKLKTQQLLKSKAAENH